MSRSRRRTLRDLAVLEDRLLAQVWSAEGTPAARDAVLQRAGIYRTYARLFRAYVRRSGDGVEGAEALRRAAFLLWCSAALPGCLTGVDELAESEQDEVIEWLDLVCKAGTLDTQLAWMLPHYDARCPTVFRRLGERPSLRSFLLDASADSWRTVALESRWFDGRGLMGHYWRALAETGVRGGPGPAVSFRPSVRRRRPSS
jgi:hypothetical protein